MLHERLRFARQQTKGEVMFKFQLPPQILSEFSSEKNYENRSTFAEVIVKIKVVYFFSETRCISGAVQ